MQRAITLISIGLISLMGFQSRAEDAKQPPVQILAGIVSAVGNDSITIIPQREGKPSGDGQTATVNDKTEIIANRHQVKLSEITVGAHVTARIHEGVALRIELHLPDGGNNGGNNGAGEGGAKEGAAPPRFVIISGELTVIDGNSITIELKKEGQAAGQRTVVATDNVEVIIEGKVSKLADLVVGQRVSVRLLADKAVRIEVPRPRPAGREGSKPTDGAKAGDGEKPKGGEK